MATFEVPEVDFSRYSNRQLAALPLAVLALALLVIVGWYFFTGAPVNLGIEFTGGTELILEESQSADQIRAEFAQPVSSARTIQTSDGTSTLITFDSTDGDAIRNQAYNTYGEETVSLVSTTSASFGASASRIALMGMAVAFVGMGLLIFALFRTFVPSVAVIVSAFSDIVVPVALMNLLGIELSLGTVAALLMLIGYSVDSDILLNNHVLRRSGGFYESVHRAMRTGVTMTLTSISAMATMAIVAYFFGIQLLASIGIVLVLGLATDLMNTYMLNLSLLRWYKYEGVAR